MGVKRERESTSGGREGRREWERKRGEREFLHAFAWKQSSQWPWARLMNCLVQNFIFREQVLRRRPTCKIWFHPFDPLRQSPFLAIVWQYFKPLSQFYWICQWLKRPTQMKEKETLDWLTKQTERRETSNDIFEELKIYWVFRFFQRTKQIILYDII